MDEETQTEEKMQWLAVNLAGSDWDWLGQVGPLTYQVLNRNTSLGVRPTHAQIQVPATDLLYHAKQSALCPASVPSPLLLSMHQQDTGQAGH